MNSFTARARAVMSRRADAPMRRCADAPMRLIAAVMVLASGADAQATPARDTLRITIADAVDRAVRVSDEVRLGQAQVDVAGAQLMTARASGLPQLRLTTTYSHAYENARAQAVGQVFNQPNSYNTNLNLSQSVFQGGRISAGAAAAEHTRAAARFALEDTRSRVATDIQRAYLQAVYTDRLVGLQTTNLELASTRLAQIVELEEAGRAARYDVLVARVARANIEPLLIQARNDRDLALLEVKRLLNVPFDQPLALTTAMNAGAVRAAAATFDTVTAAERASLRSAELAVSVRREGISIARADYLPTVSVFLQSGYQAFPPPGLGFPSRRGAASAAFCDDPDAGRVCQNGGWFSDRSVGMNVSWPVFDGFRARGNVELARAQLRLAEAQLQQEREVVDVEVARARAELNRARTVFDARQQNSAEAGEAFQLATLRFSRGLSTQLEVSDSQLAMLTAQSGEARAVFDLYLATVELARALGRTVPLPPSTVSGQPLPR
jgi:outer membrane protein TolC